MRLSSELRTRIFSAIALAIIVVFVTLWDARSFDLMIAVAGIVLLREWRELTRARGIVWMIFGLVYIGAAAAGLIYLRQANVNILLAVFAIVWAGDIAAYVIGRRFGNHKIAPRISPGKSWEGLAGSVVASAATGAIISMIAHIPVAPHAILGAILALIGLSGDMFESSLKRRAGTKDSGTLIPGHGGLFDRVDALMPCAMVSAIALYLRLHSQ